MPPATAEGALEFFEATPQGTAIMAGKYMMSREPTF